MRKFLLILTCAACLSAQELDPAKLLKPPTDNWPTFNGDYTGRRFSPLTQINKDNVGSLTLAWAFQTRAQPAVYATPLEVNGVLYFSVSNQAWAVDARTGRQIWHFDHPFNGYTLGGGSRGVEGRSGMRPTAPPPGTSFETRLRRSSRHEEVV